MKFKALALALCAMSLAAQDLTELYAKDGEYEAKGDYKNAMIYYKKIAAASLAERGEKSRRNSTETNSIASAENHAPHDDTTVLHSAKPQNSLAQNSAMAESSALNSAISNFADAGSATSSSTSNLTSSNSASLSQNSAAPQGEQNGRNFGFLGLKYYEPIYMLFTHDFNPIVRRMSCILSLASSDRSPTTRWGLEKKFHLLTRKIPGGRSRRIARLSAKATIALSSTLARWCRLRTS